MSRRPPPAPAGKRLDAVLAAGIEQKFVVQGDAPAPQRLPALTATECGAYTPMDADAVPEADQTGLYMVAGLYVFDSMKTPLYAGLQAMMARNRMLDDSKNTVYDMLMTAIRQAYVYDSRQTKPDAADPTARWNWGDSNNPLTNRELYPKYSKKGWQNELYGSMEKYKKNTALEVPANGGTLAYRYDDEHVLEIPIYGNFDDARPLTFGKDEYETIWNVGRMQNVSQWRLFVVLDLIKPNVKTYFAFKVHASKTSETMAVNHYWYKSYAKQGFNKETNWNDFLKHGVGVALQKTIANAGLQGALVKAGTDDTYYLDLLKNKSA
ncbi:MAG: hypothetical protein CMA06_02070 [Euryarchaeota archaeon]|nr:hypothetical protein [Euryarchaeota archaeon]